MEKEELLSRFRAISDPYRQKQELYDILDLLGISYKKTNCRRCILDYYNIVREELGLIEDASEFSSFNGDKEYIYLLNRTFKWKYNGKIFTINQNTPKYIIEEFIKTHKGYYSIRDTKKS